MQGGQLSLCCPAAADEDGCRLAVESRAAAPGSQLTGRARVVICGHVEVAKVLACESATVQYGAG
eukprot:1587344-Prymnesium_polylepis.2